MSNKKHFTDEECQIRKDIHLERTIKELGYEEISKTEYRRLKKDNPKNCNGYTIRVRFKYYKKKTKIQDDLILDGAVIREFEKNNDICEIIIRAKNGKMRIIEVKKDNQKEV